MTFDQYKTIIETYLDFYPDERIDIQPYPQLKVALELDAEGKKLTGTMLDTIEREGLLYITIHYPELTLTNDRGATHTIYDTYLSIRFPLMIIQMGRTTYTSQEVSVGYRHSHIYTRAFGEMTTFCTGGTDNPVNKIITMMRQEGHDFSLLVQSFIIECERMIRIESNAGGPYISFDVIGKSSTPYPITIHPATMEGLIPSSKQGILTDFFKYYCNLRMDEFYYDGRCWQLKATDAEFIERVTKVAKMYKRTRNAKIYENVHKKHGLYYQPDGNYTSIVGRVAQWKFKNAYPPLRLIDFDNNCVQEQILERQYIEVLYSFLLNLINGIYANAIEHKDSIHSRAYKIKSELIKSL